MKHTATPWGIERDSSTLWIGPMRSDGKKINEIVTSIDADPTLKPEVLQRNEADAVFIVKACNNHDELVKALQFYAEGKHYQEGHGWDSQPTVEDGEVARAALEKVSA